MNNPAISVVMPVYNGEKYLSEAIESILNQTFTNFEFIIVYDKSQDKSLEIIRKYMKIDKRIKLIELDNKGLVYSLNTGIDMAKGKYIARMDADDISLPERFELQYNHMEENPDITILGTFIEVYGNDKKANLSLTSWFNELIDKKNMLTKTAYSCPVAHPTVMMKSDFAKFEKYSNYYASMEDYELWIRAITKGYIISNVNQILLKYRMHDVSKSNAEKKDLSYIYNQRADCKLTYFFNKENKSVLIWGAGEKGKLFVDFFENSIWAEKIKILAAIDKEQTGLLNNIKVMKPDQIDRIKFDYILITESFEYNETVNYLNSLGLKNIKDYLYIM